jgi:hypothetical protein
MSDCFKKLDIDPTSPTGNPTHETLPAIVRKGFVRSRAIFFATITDRMSEKGRRPRQGVE